jgi:muramidase (phage lysozyme)
MARGIGAFLCILCGIIMGCSAEVEGDGEPAESSEAVRDANGNEVITALVDTTLKTSTQDAASLPATEVCRIPRGTTVTLRAPSVIGKHVQGRLVFDFRCGGKFVAGGTVFLFRDHFSGWSAAPRPPTDPNTPTCSPSRANGAVSTAHRALLDTIAVAEGTRGRGGQDGYNVMFTYALFSDCARHPRRLQGSSGLRSDAAGRYQFLSTTWDSLGLPNFYPDNQDRGAMRLVARRGFTVPESRPMTATEFSNLMDRISYEWASLPPGRYGQPSYSLSRMRSQYCSFAGCG